MKTHTISGYMVFTTNGRTLEATRKAVKDNRNFYERQGCKCSIIWAGNRQEYMLLWRSK